MALLICACPITSFASNENSSLPDTAVSEMESEYQTEEYLLSVEPKDEIQIPANVASASYETFSKYEIPDGIYAFKNLGNQDRWMDIQQDITVPGYHVQQYAFGTSPAESDSPSGLYKVTQVQNTGRYIIRLMINTNLTFCFSGNEVLTKEIPVNDSAVSASDTFYITYNNGGDLIRPYNGGSYYVSAKNTTASGASGAPDSFLAKRTLADAGDRARWIIEGYQTQIPNGVYAFQNVGNTSRWMDINLDSPNAGAFVQQYAFGESPAKSYAASGLYKVSQIGTTGRYVIRLMLNNALSFGFFGNYVITKTISPYDSKITEASTYKILFYNGDVIKPYGSPYVVSAQDTDASGNDGAPYSRLQRKTLSQAGDCGRWILEQYNGEVHNDLYIQSYVSTLMIGDTYTFSGYMSSTVIGRNGPLVYSVTNEDNSATDKATINSSSGKLTATGAGKIKLRMTYSGAPYIWSIPVTIEAPPEGMAFIQNRHYEKYIQIDDNDAPDYDTDGGVMEQWTFDGADYQRWNFTYVGNGYYKITSKLNDYAITVPTGDESTDGVDLILTTYSSSNDNQKWKITLTSHGSYKIKAKSSESYTAKDLVLDVNTKGLHSENGLNIQQRAYSDDTDYKDEWLIYLQKDYISMYIGYSLGDPLMPPIISAIDTAFQTQAGMDGYSYTSLTKDELLAHLASTSIFSCITHGYKSSIATTDGELSIADINSLDNAAFDDLVFVYFGACQTAAGGSTGNNLVNSVYNKGADAVLGFIENVFVSETNSWTQTFMTTLATGVSIKSAMDVADVAVRNDPNVTVPYYSTSSTYRCLKGSANLIPCS